MIGRPCRLLAYPYGSAEPRVRSAAARRYDAAFGTRLAYASAADDRFDIARIDAYYLRSPAGPGTPDLRPMARPAGRPPGLAGGPGRSVAAIGALVEISRRADRDPGIETGLSRPA